MKIGARQHPADVAASWSAPAILAGASAWSAWQALGSAIPTTGSGIVALLVGMSAMRVFGTVPGDVVEAGFEPVPFDECVDELDELLLDDPLENLNSDARVVKLFSREEATPGEMVARIADYLGENPRVPAIVTGEVPSSSTDASAALHAALANIRASLR